MARTLAALFVVLLLGLPGCSKGPGLTAGTAARKMKDPVWATYAWTRGRMVYIIYFVPNPATSFNPEGVAATGKFSKEGDVFEGALDGYLDKSKAPFKVEAKKYEVVIDGKTYRTANGSVFLVNVGSPTKVQQIQALFPSGPKDPEDVPGFMDAEVQRIANENPKIKEFPKEPAPPEKPDSKTKKK